MKLATASLTQLQRHAVKDSDEIVLLSSELLTGPGRDENVITNVEQLESTPTLTTIEQAPNKGILYYI